MNTQTKPPEGHGSNGQLQHLTTLVAGLADRIDTLHTIQAETSNRVGKIQGQMTTVRQELAENTEITKHLRDASAFVRVGTAVLKWVGVIAIAVGSVIMGWKMMAGGLPPDMTIGPKP